METKGPADEGGTRLDQQGQEGFEHADLQLLALSARFVKRSTFPRAPADQHQGVYSTQERRMRP